MARLQPAVLPLTEEDVDRVAQLWIARREEFGSPGEGARRAVDEGRFRAAVLQDHVCLQVARVDGEAVGYIWTSSAPMTATLDVPVMAIEDAFVAPEWRGQGIARAMLSAVAGHAHRQGIDHVGCALPTQDKDANRALARLGFAAVVTRRVAQTATLMRRLHGDDRRALVDQVLLQRRRREQRARVAATMAASS